MNKIIGGGLLSALMCACLCARTARAESDYEYARALLDRDGVNFQTTDLVEHLIAQLAADPKTATEAKLVHATLNRYTARTASSETRAKLLAQAEKLYADILNGPKAFPHYTVAERDAGTLDFECAVALRRSAADDPANAAEFQRDAARLLGKVAQKYRAAADAAYPAFEKAHQAIIDWQNANDPDRDGKAIPSNLVAAANKAFDAWLEPDQRNIALLLEQLDCTPESDPARKTLADELTRLCESRTANERLSEQETATAWYEMMEGKVFALLLNPTEAENHWSEARRAAVLQKPILREQVRLYMKLKKYADVLKTVENANSDVAQMLGDDVGKEILETYTRALTLSPDAAPEDFERAIRTLQAMIEREATTASRGNAGETPWGAQFCAAMADIVTSARKKLMLPALRPAEWYSTGIGFALRADEDQRRSEEWRNMDRAQFEKAVSEYENAEECFRRTIATAHASPPAVRLTVEPKAWVQLGRCYLRTEDFQEALVAYQAFKRLYAPANRTWLPDPTKSESRAFYTRQVNERIAELGPLLQKSDAAARYALSEAVRRKQLLPAEIMLSATTDLNFSQAQIKMKSAFETAELAQKQLSSEPAAASANFAQALEATLAAAEQFGKVKPDSTNYEAALLSTARAYMLAQSICAGERVKDAKPDEQRKRAREYAQKALDAFNAYDAFIAKTTAASDSVSSERERQRGPLLLARSSLSCATGAWEHALKDVEAYQAWLKQNPASRDGLDTALLTKFRALVELSTMQAAPEQEKVLNDALETLQAWRTQKGDDTATFGSMLARLISRYELIAANPAAHNQKEFLEKCFVRIADLEETRFAALKPGEATLKDHSHLVYALKRANRNAQALEAGMRLLEAFDPKGAGTHIPDDAAPWQQLLAKMIGDPKTGAKGVVRYDDLTKWDRCKYDHTVLIDYMYDTPLGAQYPDGDAHRPAFDRFNMDCDKALSQLQTIRRNYPDCATLKPELGENGQALLTIVEDEIDFRRKLAATRALVLELATKQTAEFDQAGKADEAQKCRALASKLLQQEIDAGRDTPELKLRVAELDVSLGRYEDALKVLLDLRAVLDRESTLYFDASKLCSIVYAKQQKWQQAIEFPEFIEQIAGYESKRVRERWPEMKDFLTECRKHAKP